MPSLNKWQLKGISKLGKILCPGTAQLPTFSATGALSQADRCFSFLTAEDQEGLGGLLQWLGILPAFVARFAIALADSANRWPASVAPTLRLLQIGLKGFVYSLYYADAEVRKALGFVTAVNGTAKP